MKTLRVSRVLIVAAVAALAAATVSVASERDNQHPHVLPAHLVGVPELAAVVWNDPTNGFIQFLVDRGKITAASGSTITVQQSMLSNIWRSQAFTIPATAEIHVNGHTLFLGTTASPSGECSLPTPR